MSLGIWQILIIVLLILLLFGRNKISALMGDLGKGITSFKKGLSEGKEEDKKPKPKAVAAKKPAAKKTAAKKPAARKTTKS